MIFKQAPLELITPIAVFLTNRDRVAYRRAHWIERLEGLRANPHISLQAATGAVWELRRDLSCAEAETFAQKALAWVGQARNAWLWK